MRSNDIDLSQVRSENQAENFSDNYCKDLSIGEFVEIFFDGSIESAAAAVNVTTDEINNWLSDDGYEVEVIYYEFACGRKIHDFIIKKQIKRVGAVDSEFYNKVGYVYAISNGSITKIGASVNPEKRAKKVAMDIGLTDYELFISNPSTEYRQVEQQAHKAMESLKRENTIYQRECFSCSIDEASKIIRELTPDMPSGIRKTYTSVSNDMLNHFGR